MQFKIAVAWISLTFITIFHVAQQNVEAGQFKRGEYEHLHFANFKEFFNHMLNVSRQVLASMDVEDYIDCAIQCLSNMACFSFNVAILPNNNTGLHVCHLLTTDKYNHPGSFVQSNHFHHYASAIGNPCESFPCQNGGTCRPLYTQNGYRCECLDGINGMHCEKVTSCPRTWTKFKSYCYMYRAISVSMTWDKAQEHCKGLGGNLVKIRSAEENEFVLNMVSKIAPSLRGIWIGLKWNTSVNDFLWRDHSVPIYKNWAPEEPNGNGTEPCGTMYTSDGFRGYWNDYRCGIWSSGVVCKRLP